MVFKLTRDDAAELRRALEAAHIEILRELSGLAGCGYSHKGIDLCRRRRRVEFLIDCTERLPEVETMTPPATADLQLIRSA